MTGRRLAVVSAGLSRPSTTRLLADRLGEAASAALEDAGLGVDLQVVELRDLAHQVTDNLLTGFPAPPLRAAIDTVVRADGVVAVSPIFAASYSGLFKSFFDVLDADALAGTPVLLGATGGTERHSLALEHALRPLFAYLRAVTVPTAVYAATSDFGTAEAGGLDERIGRAAGELATLVAGRPPGPPPVPSVDPTPFAELLAR
ncbi:MAG: LLM-partnered reductase, family [Nocardioidaceae bacterium]|jgi:FMN reductase|nr:LLM-partnered reductase, family [Nocardioidaceae bacterium]